VSWLDIERSKFSDSKSRYGKVNEHNSWVPRDHGLEDWEKKAIIEYYATHPLEGYRRLTFMMLDADAAQRPAVPGGRGEPLVRLPRIARCGADFALEPEGIEEGDRVRAADRASPALARRHRLRQLLGDVLPGA
jgi:hypothetical protein